MVFQDPTDSLNPRYTAARAIADPILRFGSAKLAATRCAHATEVLAQKVGLPLDLLDRLSASAVGRAEGARRHRPRDRVKSQIS